jgi:peptidoglycan/LPS O-acetylase OafA/YrhL
VYVLHFPVVQTFLAVGIFHKYLLFSVGSIAVIVACLAFASWHLVEKPYLLRSRAKRQLAHSVMTRA